jgi:alanine dehydrogenase
VGPHRSEQERRHAGSAGLTEGAHASTGTSSQRDVMTLILNNHEIESLLDMRESICAMEEAFEDLANGKAVNRPRSHTYTELADHRYYMFKSMDGSFPRHGIHALRLSSDIVEERVVDGKLRREKIPAAPGQKWLGLVQIFSIETGELLAIMQDGFLQKMRVGATSGLAAKCLSRPDSHRVGLFGTGWQADAQLLALCEVRDIREITVFSPNGQNLERFVQRMKPLLKVSVVAASGPRAVVENADIVVGSTNSLQPVFDGSWLQPGMHVNSLQNGELDELVLARSDVIAVRAREKSTHWAVPGHAPAETRRIADPGPQLESRTQELGDILVGKSPGRTSEKQITMFGGSGSGGSSGLGIQFAAVGHVILEKARTRRIGRVIPSDWFLEDVHP